MILPLKCLEREVTKKIEELRSTDYFFKALTAEKSIAFLERLPLHKRKNLLIVLDEIHLWNLWGNDFRPVLWESLYYFGTNQYSILGLTATLKEEYKREWKDLFNFGSYDFEVLDYGNGELSNKPVAEKSYFGLQKSQLRRRICYEIEKNKTCLIFCQYREEVFELERFLLKQLGSISILTCVGGEAKKFIADLESKGAPQIILATSTLSHGVNLGVIERVFLTYEVLHWDIYLQMKARGGRGGEPFEVISYQRDKTGFISKIKLKLFDRYLSLFYA